MQAIVLSYGNKYRKRCSYRGHLWENRFQSRIIQGDKYILECLDYIHHNPVKAGIVAEAKDYPWSSYFVYCGLENKKVSERIGVDRYGDISLISISR